jgi:hypothetical protein
MTFTPGIAVWTFESSGHLRWFTASCEKCKTSCSHIRTNLHGFRHCGIVEFPPDEVVKQYDRWTRPEGCIDAPNNGGVHAKLDLL